MQIHRLVCSVCYYDTAYCYCSPEEIEDFAAKMLGSRLITKQTGSRGRRCNKVRLVVLQGEAGV